MPTWCHFIYVTAVVKMLKYVNYSSDDFDLFYLLKK